ncbi:hypothetical protein H0H93_001072 [Arthromyces matolae]|nr:hypothetical protein H0H93_001072 [Arthromyces matolae]
MLTSSPPLSVAGCPRKPPEPRIPWTTPGALTRDCGHQMMSPNSEGSQIGIIPGLAVWFVLSLLFLSFPPLGHGQTAHLKGHHPDHGHLVCSRIPVLKLCKRSNFFFSVLASADLAVFRLRIGRPNWVTASYTRALLVQEACNSLEDLAMSIINPRLYISRAKFNLCSLSRPISLRSCTTTNPPMHLHAPSDPPEPPSPSESTRIYDEAERGGTDPGIETTTFNPHLHTHFYGPIAVPEYFFGQSFTDGPSFLAPQANHGPDSFAEHLPDVAAAFFGEQIGGGGGSTEVGQTPDPHTPTPQSRRSRRPVHLTPRAQHTAEAINFARSREAAIAGNPPTPSPPPTFIVPGAPTAEELPQSQTLADDLAFLEGLSQSDLAPLAHDRSSDFTISPPITDGSSNESGPLPARSTSLLNDFYVAGEFERLAPKQPLPKSPIPVSEASMPSLASGPVASSDQATETTSKRTQPVASSDQATETTSKRTQPVASSDQATETTSKRTQPDFRSTPAPPSSPEGRPSRQDLQDCHEVFQEVHGLFEDLANRLNRPKSSIVKWFNSGSKAPRRESSWNLYQAYFARHSAEERERSGLPDGTDSDCWASFQEHYGDDTDAVLHAARELDCKLNQKETLQQRSRSFQQYTTKLENLIKEGTEHRFHTFAVAVGDCVLEDQGLNAIVTSPGLQNFATDRLKLANDQIMGLAKVQVYDKVARTVTESIDAEKIIQELDAILDSIEADLAPASHIVAVGGSEDEDEDEENNVILSCKNRLVSLLKAATEAAGMRWEKDRLPWTTLVQYLVGISHVIDGWPAGAAMPHETTKAKKAEANKSRKGKGKENISQGIKDLSTKDGRLLLTSLQDGTLTIRKADRSSIMNDTIAVIKTALPTHRDDLCVRLRGIYASGRTFVGGGCPKTGATTRVRPKKVTVVDVSSDSSDPPTANIADSSNPSTAKKMPPAVVDISSDSSSPPPMVPKTTTSLSGSKQPPHPAPRSKRSAPKIGSSSDDEEETSESRKRPRCSPTHLGKEGKEDAGSGDDYVANDEVEAKGRARRPAPRPRRKQTGKEKKQPPSAKLTPAGVVPPPGPDPSSTEAAPEAPSGTSKPGDLPTRGSSLQPSSAGKINRPPNLPQPYHQPPPRLNPTSAPSSHPATSATKPSTQPVPPAEKSSEGAKPSPQAGPDPGTVKSTSQAAAPSQHPPTGSSKPGAQPAPPIQRPRTGQDIVDSFPPLRRPPAPPSSEQGQQRSFRSQQRLPSGQPSSTSDSMQTNRATGSLPHRFPDAQGNFESTGDPNFTPAGFDDYPMHDADPGAYQSFPHRYPHPPRGPPTGYPRSRGRGYPQRHRGVPPQHYGPNTHHFNSGYGSRRSASGSGTGPATSGAYLHPNYWGLQPYGQGEYEPEEDMGERDDYGYDGDDMLS